MQVIVDEIVTTVRAVDGDSVLAPKTLQAIVRAVLQAVAEQKAHERRAEAELRLDGARLDRQSER
jgi:hypothetical protein